MGNTIERLVQTFNAYFGMQNQNTGVSNISFTQTGHLGSIFENHGNQFLKFYLLPFLNVQDRTAMRGTCQTIHKNIPQPQYSYFKTKKYGEAKARLELNTGFVETFGDSSKVSSDLRAGVKTIYSTSLAFAALKKNGKVITWGSKVHGGYSKHLISHLQSEVKTICSTHAAFAALKTNGSVVTWGSPDSGGDSSEVFSHLQSGVKNIYSTDGAFAALKENGSVLTWGDSDFGGDSESVISHLQSGVKTICAIEGAFAALKKNGSVVNWGDDDVVASSSVLLQLQSEVKHICSTDRNFAALKTNGCLIIWGQPIQPHEDNPYDVLRLLQNEVIQIEAIDECGFCITQSDGKQTQWPYPNFDVTDWKEQS